MGETDPFAVEDDPRPELPVRQIVQTLDAERIWGRLDGVEIRGGTRKKDKEGQK
jgi:hypothetical protein